MSENWAIAIMGVGFGAMSAILAWMGSALWGIHRDLRNFVTREDCTRQMQGHCGEIDSLWKQVSDNQRRVASLETIADIFHHQGDSK